MAPCRSQTCTSALLTLLRHAAFCLFLSCDASKCDLARSRPIYPISPDLARSTRSRPSSLSKLSKLPAGRFASAAYLPSPVLLLLLAKVRRLPRARSRRGATSRNLAAASPQSRRNLRPISRAGSPQPACDLPAISPSRADPLRRLSRRRRRRPPRWLENTPPAPPEHTAPLRLPGPSEGPGRACAPRSAASAAWRLAAALTIPPRAARKPDSH